MLRDQHQLLTFLLKLQPDGVTLRSVGTEIKLLSCCGPLPLSPFCSETCPFLSQSVFVARVLSRLTAPHPFFSFYVSFVFVPEGFWDFFSTLASCEISFYGQNESKERKYSPLDDTVRHASERCLPGTSRKSGHF